MALGEDLDIEGVETLDVEGRVVMPSFVDMHTHFRDPGYTYKEDLLSGSQAALRGGYTFVNLMGNTKPISSSMSVVEYVEDKVRDNNLIGMHQVISITKDFGGEDISHLAGIDSRVRCISDDGVGVLSNKAMYEAMNIAREKDMFLLVHPEDKYISKVDDRLSENLMTLRDLGLMETTKARLHVAHVSTREIVDYIRFFKTRVDGLTAEVTPHHISLYDNDYRVNPSIREKEDVDSLIEGLRDGTIDMIATDHAPHTEEDKANGSPGLSGLETSFTVSYTELVRKNGFSLSHLSKLMSGNPSRLLGLNKGRLEPGYDGDLTVVDLDVENKIDRNKFVSKGKNTPFHNMTYYGDVVYTIYKGEVRYGGEDIDK